MLRNSTARWLLLIAAAALTAAACGGDENPSAAFDGETCDYSGPDSVGSDGIEVSFENNSSSGAGLAFLSLVDESARSEEVALIGTRASVAGAPPGEALELVGVLEADAGATTTQDAPLPAGTYFIDCVTFSAGGPDEVWRAAVLEVTG